MINRLIKDPSEILAIENACKLGDKTFEYILTNIKEGATEKELAFKIKLFIKKHRADIAFPPIVAFGKNSAFPHHKPTDQKLSTKDIILIDLGVKLKGFCSDMSRTVFLGVASTELKKMYQTVLNAQQKALEAFSHLELSHLEGGSPKRSEGHDSFEMKFYGIKASEVDRVARDYITSKGYPTIPHSLGHGIGLKVHEPPKLSPKSKDILKVGMVFTIEPGIYIPSFGGVRIEDVFVLEKSGPRSLTKSTKEIIAFY